MHPARTVDEVIDQLNEVVARARAERSRLGFFAALYRNVTVRVKEGISAGRFEDGPRMERLDVIFANRYLEALGQYRRGERASRCWLAAFEAASRWRHIIIQHLLLGINAHINLDLGAAVALTSPADQLPALRRDFDEINDILRSMLDDAQERLGRVSPWIPVLDRAGGRTDEAVMNFSIARAREGAWGLAARLAPLASAEMQAELDRVDRRVESLARVILNPGWFLRLAGLVVRIRESNDAPRIIEALN